MWPGTMAWRILLGITMVLAAAGGGAPLIDVFVLVVRALMAAFDTVAIIVMGQTVLNVYATADTELSEFSTELLGHRVVARLSVGNDDASHPLFSYNVLSLYSQKFCAAKVIVHMKFDDPYALPTTPPPSESRRRTGIELPRTFPDPSVGALHPPSLSPLLFLATDAARSPQSPIRPSSPFCTTLFWTKTG